MDLAIGAERMSLIFTSPGPLSMNLAYYLLHLLITPVQPLLTRRTGSPETPKNRRLKRGHAGPLDAAPFRLASVSETRPGDSHPLNLYRPLA